MSVSEEFTTRSNDINSRYPLSDPALREMNQADTHMLNLEFLDALYLEYTDKSVSFDAAREIYAMACELGGSSNYEEIEKYFASLVTSLS